MPPAEKAKVKIKIAKGVRHFTDGPRLFGPGTWDVLPKVAERLVSLGKATLVGAGAASAKTPAPGKPTAPANDPPATNPRIPPAPEPEESVPTPLPEDFPSREVLVAAGFDSVESLKAPDAKEKLSAIEGLTPADVTKIGLAISKI